VHAFAHAPARAPGARHSTTTPPRARVWTSANKTRRPSGSSKIDFSLQWQNRHTFRGGLRWRFGGGSIAGGATFAAVYVTE
jgi:hypothetical protein